MRQTILLCRTHCLNAPTATDYITKTAGETARLSPAKIFSTAIHNQNLSDGDLASGYERIAGEQGQRPPLPVLLVWN